MNVIGLDLATSTGVAIGRPGEAPRCFTQRLGDPGSPHDLRFAEAFSLAKRLIADHKPVLIGLERPIMRAGRDKTDTVLLLGGLRAAVLLVARVLEVRVHEFEVGTIDRHFLGAASRGGREVRKRAIRDRCRSLGWRFNDDDQSDACAVWDVTCSRMSRSHAVATAPLFHGRT